MGVKNFDQSACENNPDDTGISCGSTAWNPASHVSFSSGVYHVNAAWLANLVAHPSPLWTCDDAYLGLMPGGGIEVGRASSGELLYVLGLRNGDIPLYVNSMPLDDFMDGVDAWIDLYRAGETDYYLTIDRGGTFITLQYELV